MSVLLINVVLVFYILTFEYQAQGFGLLQNVQYSDKCLHVKESSIENNGGLEIVTCDSSQTDQQLNVEDWANYGSNPGQIIFQFNKKCLTVNAAGTSNGDIVNQYDCWNGASNQLWKIVGSYDANFQIQNVGSSKCLTAEGDGTYTDQWDCLGESTAPHQTWRIAKTTAGQSGDGIFAFENALFSGKCLNAADGISGTTSSLNLKDCDTTSSTQLFAATNLASIYGSITLYGTNLCLNLYGESEANGGQIGTYSCSTNNAKNEIWGLRLDDANPSAFQIVSGLSGKCLTADSGGTWIDQWDCLSYAGAPHQWWKLKTPLSPPSDIPTTGSLLESVVFPNQCLRIQSRSMENNADMQLMSCNPLDSAQVLSMNNLAWDSLSSSPGAISLLRSSKCLTINGASSENGAHVNQYDCVSPTPGNQQWTVVASNSDGYEGLFELQNVGSGKCLTAEGGGSYLDQWECYSYNTAPHQFWRIRPIGASASGSHNENFDSYWTCNMDTGLMDADEVKNLTCGMWCVEKNDPDGTRGFSGGFCYKGWWGKRYCACSYASKLNNDDIRFYQETNLQGGSYPVGGVLYSRADCVSFDDKLYKKYNYGGLKSINYNQGVCLKLWFQYGCLENRSASFRSDLNDHYKLLDIPNRVGDVKAVSRYFC